MIATATRSAVVAAVGDRRSVVTIGAYDGVHLGHRTVIGQPIGSFTHALQSKR
ncbi:MAG: hypothetical protein ACKOE7_16165 [Actinomycetota bacterium]